MGAHNFHETDVAICSEIWENIVCTQGSMYPTIHGHTEMELRALVLAATQGTITALWEREHSGWIGGSSLSSLSTPVEMRTTNEECGTTGPPSSTSSACEVRICASLRRDHSPAYLKEEQRREPGSLGVWINLKWLVIFTSLIVVLRIFFQI